MEPRPYQGTPVVTINGRSALRETAVLALWPHERRPSETAALKMECPSCKLGPPRDRRVARDREGVFLNVYHSHWIPIPFAVDINANALAARDGWRCGICREPIPLVSHHTRRSKEPGGLTIDHIIPISRGGPDTDENLQAAHWRCNQWKGNAAANERESLIYDLYCATLKRDAPICYICGRMGNPRGPRSHPWSLVVDHVTPCHLGGGRLDPSNQRAAHFWCNIQKGDAIECSITFVPASDSYTGWHAEVIRRERRGTDAQTVALATRPQCLSEDHHPSAG